MILGIGTDLCDIRRIEKLLQRFGEAFVHKILTPQEMPSLINAAFVAKRFAAKEAVLKALGTGLAKGLQWKHIEILKDDAGQPLVVLKDKALEIINKKIPPHAQWRLDLSLTDEYPYAQAFVVISWMKEND